MKLDSCKAASILVGFMTAASLAVPAWTSSQPVAGVESAVTSQDLSGAESDSDEPYRILGDPEYYGDQPVPSLPQPEALPGVAPAWHGYVFGTAVVGVALIAGLGITAMFMRAEVLLRARGSVNYRRRSRIELHRPVR